MSHSANSNPENRARKMRTLIISILVLLFISPLANASWTEYTTVRYMDLDGDLADEIIIEAKHGAGSNHYIEDMRIFKDNYPKLELIFTIRTLDSYFGLEANNNYNIISDVKFTEQTTKNKGVRDIIVSSKKVYYKDDENRVVDKEDDLGVELFKWNGKTFVTNRTEGDIKSYKVDLDNDGNIEIITVEQSFDKLKDGSLVAIKGIIKVVDSQGGEVDNFSMPDRLEKVEFISLNKDGLKQIVAWSSGGVHYTNLAIYGYKNGKLYRIFENGSGCAILTDFNSVPPKIKVGIPKFEEKGWSYADEPDWEIWACDGKEFKRINE